uniref:BHLH domain-containing protein n=1 Tax=Neogobius melanostomus TaxID=47308 RepID=A0A8C6T8K4_9GOBI
MPEMTETQTPGRKPKKKKNKESHNAVERHRKEKINAGINLIGNLLPCSQALKQSKIMILDQAFRYITELKKQNDTMLLEGGDKTQAEEIRHLRCQLEEMRKESAHYMELLKAHDILEDPSIHWKGKQRCAKTGNVTQTSQIQKGIIVYSSGKDLSPGTQPSETLVLQQPSKGRARLSVNGALLQVNTSSSTPSLLPGSALTTPQSTPAVRVIDQCVVENPTVAPSIPPAVSYITLRIPAVTTALPPQPVPATPVHTLTVPTTTVSPLPSESAAVPQTSLNHIITPPRPTASGPLSLASLDTSTRKVTYTAVAQSQHPIRAQVAGSTQTTWTTLQMAGNTVQPVCQNLPTPDDSTATQRVQRVNVCQPFQVQMQPAVPAPQTPIISPIQSQLRTTILGPPNPSAVLGTSAIMAQPAVVSQSAVLQPAPLVTHPPLVPQPQSTVLPLLQTMQVLQVKTANPTAPGVTAAQNTNNPSVVILQQANTCPAQSIVREEIGNQTPCQHIVIIQAPKQSAPASQNPPVTVVPAALPTVPSVSTSTSMPCTSAPSVSSPQTVGGKQLVHILPRPVQPQHSKCQPVTPPSTSAAVTPQTITVNGQVFALQPVKTTDNLISNGGQTTLQLVQPTTTEEPTTNVALNSLGALSSLNQSITQGIPLAISNHNSLSLPSTIPHQPPNVTAVSESTVALPVQVPCLKPITPALVVNPPKTPGRKPSTSIPAKKTRVKRIKLVKNKEQKPKQPAVILAKTTAVTSVSQTTSNVFTNSAAEIIPSSSSVATTTICSQSICQSVNVTIVQSTDKINVSCAPDGKAVSSQTSFPSIGSSTATKTNNNLVNMPNTSETTAVSDITSRLLETTKESENVFCATKVSVPEVKLQKESSIIQKSTSQPVVSDTKSSFDIETPIQTSSTNGTVAASLKKTVRSSPVCHPQGSHIQEAPPCSTPGSTTSPAVCTTNSVLSPFLSEPISTTVTSLGAKTVLGDVGPLQKTNMNPLCQPCETSSQGRQSEALEEKRNKTLEQINPVTDNSITSKKDFALNQQIYTNLDDQTSESSLSMSNQTESPMSTVTGGRGFSVASMLPQGQSMSAASGSFSSFILTSEQAEMLALAMLEQDSPDRKTGGCTGNKTALSNPSTGTWELTKPPVSTAKDCVSAGQQGKFHKTSMDTLKTAVPPVRGQMSEANLSGQTISRHPQNISYSHSQSAPQPQNASQSSTVASLSVNNLIRTSSSQQHPYSGSPIMTGHTSVPSPVCTTAHISQPSNNALSPAQLLPSMSTLP